MKVRTPRTRAIIAARSIAKRVRLAAAEKAAKESTMSNVFSGQADTPAVEQIHPRDPAGSIRIGSRDGKSWESLMLFDHGNDSLLALFQSVDKIAAFLGNASHLDGAAWTSQAQALGRELSEIKAKLPKLGGTPSAGLKGCAAGIVGG